MRNTAWLEQVRNYHGHHTRAAWSLLGYEPRYRSFNTKKRVTGINSLLFGEGTSVEQVTVAIHTGRLIESDNRASASRSDSKPAKTATAEAGTSSQSRAELLYLPAQRKERRGCCADVVSTSWWRTWRPFLSGTSGPRPRMPPSMLVMLRLRRLLLLLPRPPLPPVSGCHRHR